MSLVILRKMRPIARPKRLSGGDSCPRPLTLKLTLAIDIERTKRPRHKNRNQDRKKLRAAPWRSPLSSSWGCSCNAEIRLELDDPLAASGRNSYPSNCTATTNPPPVPDETTRKTLPRQRTRMLSARVISDGITRVISMASASAIGKSVWNNAPLALKFCVYPHPSRSLPATRTETGKCRSKRCAARRST
jgi:hypothetical protein